MPGQSRSPLSNHKGFASSFQAVGLLIAVLLPLSCALAKAENTLILTSGKSALPGSAYASDRQDFIGGQCVTGTLKPTGASESSFQLDQTISESDLSNQLGFTLGGRARFGVVETSLAASFLSRSISNAYSVSAIYVAQYAMQPERMDATTLKLTQVGTDAKNTNNFERWTETCGDSLVDELRKGGKLFVSIRIDFSSLDKKQEFSSKFSIAGPLYGADATLSSASGSFNEDSKVTISAYQVGGDITKLSGIFQNSDNGRDAFVQCSLGTFSSCSTVIKDVLQYAADTTSGFPSQLTPSSVPGPAVLAYGISPYTAYGIYQIDYPHLAEAVTLARAELDTNFERTYRQDITAQRLLATNLNPRKQRAVSQTLNDIKSNITALLKVSDTCYNTPVQCPDAVNGLHLTTVDDSALLPDSFATLCSDSLQASPGDPLLTTVKALVQLVDQGGSPQNAEDCRIYGTLLQRLKYLNLTNKNLTDISPLASMQSVERLVIDGNQIADISALAEMRELTLLSAKNNRISSLGPLADDMQLSEIELAGNRIQDASALKNHIRLQLVDLTGNQLSDLTPFAELSQLLYLNVAGNNVSSLAPFKQQYRLGCIGLQNTLVPDSEIGAFRKISPITVVVRNKGYAVMWNGADEYACKIP